MNGLKKFLHFFSFQVDDKFISSMSKAKKEICLFVVTQPPLLKM